MAEVQERIWESVENNRADLIELTQKLISHYSISGSEKEVQDYVAEFLTGLGFKLDIFEPDLSELIKRPTFYKTRDDYAGSPNVVGTLTGSGGGRSLILNGHIDVVPATREEWTDEIDSGKIEDGRIYGRGASDMKAGFAACIIAVKALQEAGLKLKGDIIVESVVEEETGGAGTQAAVLRGYTADAAIIAEPTDDRIFPITMGCSWGRVTVEGLSTHGSMRYQGVSAIDKAYIIIEAIKAYEAKQVAENPNPLYAHAQIPYCVNVGQIEAGNWPATVPGIAVLQVRMGIAPGIPVETARKNFEDAIREAADADPWMKDHQPVVEWFGPSWGGGGADVNDPIVQTLRKQYIDRKQKEPEIVGAPWPADAIFLAERNIPAINFGPGDNLWAHKADESVSIERLMDCAAIIAGTIAEWCGVED
ncbi:acetylornithine deacetylase [Clostridia bacterium]|nr:acetylornithine deacetylase [Clostridia bacterium]